MTPHIYDILPIQPLNDGQPLRGMQEHLAMVDDAFGVPERHLVVPESAYYTLSDEARADLKANDQAMERVREFVRAWMDIQIRNLVSEGVASFFANPRARWKAIYAEDNAKKAAARGNARRARYWSRVAEKWHVKASVVRR